MIETHCRKCNRSLIFDEVGLHKKLLGKQETAFYCRSCLASYFSVSEVLLQEKIEEFKKAGCLLFFEEKYEEWLHKTV